MGAAAPAVAPAAAFLRAERVSGPGEESSPVVAIVVVATSSTLLLPLDAAFDIAHEPLRGVARALVFLRKGKKRAEEERTRKRKSGSVFRTLKF